MLYAGFDCSTQGLTVVVIDCDRREVVFRDVVSFDDDLPEFGTHHGVLASPQPGVVHAPPGMWSAALERLLALVARSIDASRLRCLSGSAQQHGSVCCGMTPGELTRTTAPVWLDSSTARECAEIEAALGGPRKLADLTGSRAFPRFTGPQIRKFVREAPADYARTARIHLVSSYLASILTGAHAPVDHADASGMNLMDLRARAWAPRALEATAPHLAARLPPLVPSSSIVGTLKSEWQQRFALPPALVAAWSGDNPCSLVGTGLVREGDLAVSLGTSDTIFGPMREPRVSADGIGHTFASPIGEYMGITVFRNGSLARESVRNACGVDWNGFSAALASTEPGNDGAIMLPWFEPEITPPVLRPAPASRGFPDDAPRRRVRALVEAQMIAMARYSAWMGVRPSVIHATGGGAANEGILRVMADAFDATVYRFAATDAAALGAALRAWQADSRLPWPDVVGAFVHPLANTRIDPVPSHVTLYRSLHGRYSALERAAMNG